MTSRRVLQTVLLAAVLALAGIVIWLVVSDRSSGAAPIASGNDAPAVLNDETHVINQASDEQAVLVEFLDFECEACRAFYPAVEQLRADFPDELTLAIRYFPIPSHANAQNAALAVEAAARQEQLEGMYQRMYETQSEWGEKRDSQASVFRGFAQDLGLNLEQYDADLADPAVAARVQRDFDDGRALGVQGTPTFFLDGQRLEASDPNELYQLVQEALQG
ncbi:thioredoxin domain-containing protein [Isoptericola sp. NPDC019482]|uniref:DsbA family protein n=1 Tax=Isoptericola sp. NPDC019482 TaxID=3154688 RepID=UPI00348BE9FF